MASKNARSGKGSNQYQRRGAAATVGRQATAGAAAAITDEGSEAADDPFDFETEAESLRAFLRQYSTLTERFAREGWAFHSIEHMVLERGEMFQGASLPDDVERGEMGECFSNAYYLALGNPGLSYVEGYGSGAVIAVQHAWCVDNATGLVIDPTWNEPERIAYLGVRIDIARVTEIIEDTGYYGVLGNDWLRKHTVLKTGVI